MVRYVVTFASFYVVFLSYALFVYFKLMKTYGNASAPPERGTFFRLEIYIRVRKLHLESLTYDLFKVSQTKKIINHKTLIYFLLTLE